QARPIVGEEGTRAEKDERTPVARDGAPINRLRGRDRGRVGRATGHRKALGHAAVMYEGLSVLHESDEAAVGRERGIAGERPGVMRTDAVDGNNLGRSRLPITDDDDHRYILLDALEGDESAARRDRGRDRARTLVPGVEIAHP